MTQKIAKGTKGGQPGKSENRASEDYSESPLSFVFLKIFLNSFRFTTQLRGTYRDFPYSPTIFHVQPPSLATSLTRTVYLRVHSWCCTSWPLKNAVVTLLVASILYRQKSHITFDSTVSPSHSQTQPTTNQKQYFHSSVGNSWL